MQPNDQLAPSLQYRDDNGLQKFPTLNAQSAARTIKERSTLGVFTALVSLNLKKLKLLGETGQHRQSAVLSGGRWRPSPPEAKRREVEVRSTSPASLRDPVWRED